MKQGTRIKARPLHLLSSTHRLVSCLVILSLLASCSSWERKCTDYAKISPTLQEPPREPLPYTEIDLNRPLNLVTNPILYVYKEKRRLLVVDRGVLVRDYPIGLGSHPVGDKVMQGDGRTPEGEFFICLKNPSSRFYKSLGLNYPTPKHAQEARYCGKISEEDFQKVQDACSSRTPPPWNTPLGGAIMIHGGGNYGDWTEGCVAVQNSAIDELFEIASVGTPVLIMP